MDEYHIIWTNRPTLNAGNCNPGDRLMGSYLEYELQNNKGSLVSPGESGAE